MRESDHNPKQIDRFLTLCDGIFAVAMTLLALELVVPSGLDRMQLAQAGAHLQHKVWAYVISFFILGSYWLGHAVRFAYVQSTDGWFTTLNLISLMFVAVVPPATSLISNYPNEVWTVESYLTIMLCIGLADYAAWAYGLSHGIIETQSRTETANVTRIRMLLPTIAAVAMVVAPFSPEWAIYSSGILMLLSRIFVRRFRRQLRKEESGAHLVDSGTSEPG